MIFTPEEARLILAGRKTQARRRAIQLPRMPAPALDLTPNQRLHTTRHREGHVYPLERLARPGELTADLRMRIEAGVRRARPPAITVGHVRCTRLRLVMLGDIDLRDARAEGHRTTHEFAYAWVQARDRGWLEQQPDSEDAERAVLRRFDEAHADTLVWALTLEVVDSPRWLKASYSVDNYTDIPGLGLWDEPEPLSPDDLDRVAGYAAARDHDRRRQPLATHAHNIARELDELVTRTAAAGISDRSMSRTISALEHHAGVLARKLAAGTVA